MEKKNPRRHNTYRGLTAAEVARSRAEHGANVLTPKAQKPWWREFLAKFSDPLIVILLVAGILSIGISLYEYYGLGNTWKVFFEPIGIFMAILLATGLAFIFEHNANKAFQILNHVNDEEPVEVIRDGTTTTVPRRDIVVGDIVVLSTGSEVPADGVLLDAVTMSIDESTLTGEPMCHKTTDPEHFDPEATYPSDHVLRGTKVMEGHGVMRVTAVGDTTEMGRVFEEAQIDDSVKTPLNEQLDRLAMLITYASYVIAALVIVCQIIGFLGWGSWQSYSLILPVGAFFWLVMKMFRRWSRVRCAVAIVVFGAVFFAVAAWAYGSINAGSVIAWNNLFEHTLLTLMIAVTLIVVSVPEGLPMAVTLSMAYSMQRMLQTNNLVRRMHACETMGATTVICTDKTGTLTQNRMQVADTVFFDTTDAAVAEAIAVNSTARLDRSTTPPTPVGNPTEGALLLWLNGKGVDFEAVADAAEHVAELPFTTERKYMATIVRSAITGRLTLYVKGAPEIVLAMCAPDAGRADLEARLLTYQNQGMRTLALAALEIDSADGVIEGDSLHCPPLHLMGIVAISDPVREDVPEAVAECFRAGIAVKIVTGDTPATAREIARQIGLWTEGDGDANIITGPEFAALSDEELLARAMDIKIIARARPADKRRFVDALQRLGQVVAVTGDGTNDAPALHQAHVGLSMGDGTSVAKEASDITIIDNSFSSIGRAVMWGRSLYRNIQRFLLFQLTVNVAACLLVLMGSLFGTESPLTVTQMLWVNLIMDTFGATALASLPPSRSVMNDKPRDRRKLILTPGMSQNILGVGFVFFAITFAMYMLFIHADVTSIPAMFHAHIGAAHMMTAYEMTLLFSVFVWTHFWYMFDVRTFYTGRSIFAMPLSAGFWTIAAVILAGQMFITEVAWEFFNVSPMIHTVDWKFNPSGTIDLIIIVVGSSLVLFVREIYHWTKKKFA